VGIEQKLLSTSMITTESARILSNNLVLGKSANRDFDTDFGVRGAKIGSVVNIRRPIRPRERYGPVIDPTAVVESYTPLAFTGPIGVDYAFTSTEMKLSIDDFSNRFIKPAMVRIANIIDVQGYTQLLSTTGQTVGTPGTALTSATAADAVLMAAAKLYEQGVQPDDGMLTEVNSPQFNAVLASGSSKLFNPTSEISRVYRKGTMGEFGGAEHFVSGNLGRHTVGTFGGTARVNGAGQTGDSLVTDGWTATTTSLNPGDSFTIAGVNAVGPTGKSLGYLRQFSVTTKTVTNGAGASTISFSPAIEVGVTVDAAPADDALITVLGTTGQSFAHAIMFHRDSLLLASVDLDVPPNVEGSFMRDTESGIGIRFIRDYDVRTDQWISRFDVMTAWGSLYPQLAVRIIAS
jgi:hypothetical protein